MYTHYYSRKTPVETADPTDGLYAEVVNSAATHFISKLAIVISSVQFNKTNRPFFVEYFLNLPFFI